MTCKEYNRNSTTKFFKSENEGTKDMKMTKKIYCYMKIHQIDIQKVSKETGIDRKIFQKQPVRPLNATELCEVCAYLKIQPEEIAKDDTLF